jgi:hypothetical protein
LTGTATPSRRKSHRILPRNLMVWCVWNDAALPRLDDGHPSQAAGDTTRPRDPPATLGDWGGNYKRTAHDNIHPSPSSNLNKQAIYV